MTHRPEILAPAGDLDCVHAALAAGADAIYFGLDDGFNARARAANFPSTDLAPIVAAIHRGNARAYVALNTLVFESELPLVAELIARCGHAGVDALIVQDPAVALLARAICPSMEVHASTQMTVSAPQACTLIAQLGVTRVVVPRELSVEEIRSYAAQTAMPLEVFIHGALCVSWSGQCLTSESWGGRSANRGQCAQSCRLPYELVVDDVTRPLGEVAYLLSPADLVGSAAVPELVAAGVASLKIEGRLKGPAYVATAVAHYRGAVATATGESWAPPMGDIIADHAALQLAYNRGASAGFLGGVNHQTLVEGRFGRHRGVALGRVVAVRNQCVVVTRDSTQRCSSGGRAMDASTAGQQAATALPPPNPFAPPQAEVSPKPGMGVVFDRGQPDQPEQGGPIFAVQAAPDGTTWELRFGTPGPDLRAIAPGDWVWINSAPEISKVGTRAVEVGQKPAGRVPVNLVVSGHVNAPLRVVARARYAGQDLEVQAQSEAVATAAQGGGLAVPILREKLGAFGGTIYHLATLQLDTDAALHVPVSHLKAMGRRLRAALDAAIAAIPAPHVVAPGQALDNLRASVVTPRATDTNAVAPAQASPCVIPLCRTDEQLDALLAAGASEIELDWMEFVGLGRAVARVHAAGAKAVVATTRIVKPGEDKLLAHIAKLAPHGVLVRNWAALAYFASRPERPILHGDFSLNITNSLTAAWVAQQGLATLTCAHDLDATQLFALLDATDAARMAVTVHHHIPTFHTEHCVYAHLLSHGANYQTCGRPCEAHRVSLRDRVGMVHPVVVDVGCRNTVFNAQAQSAAGLCAAMVSRGVRRLRVEFVRETGSEAVASWHAYQQLVAGTVSAAHVAQQVAANEQFGVTAGTMRTLHVLR